MQELKPEFFSRIDESDDELFYRTPRIVKHIDENACLAIENFYDEILPTGKTILDLMSSAFSHFPIRMLKEHVIGLGMNSNEMATNPMLTSYVVHNLNRDPILPFDNNNFGAIVITVSIQYLTQPIEVFQQAHRVLETSGSLIVVFSNRMFPTKAVSIWRVIPTGQQHQQLVESYFDITGNYENIRCIDITTKCEGYTDPVYVVTGQKG